MIINYLKLTYRTFIKYKGHSFINIFGLSIGIGCFIIIYLFVNYHQSFDGFHEKANNIYRVIQQSDNGEYFAGSPAPFGPTLITNFPEIESFVRIAKPNWNSSNLIKSREKSFYESDLYLADSNFFSLFSFPLIKGDPSTALSKPNSIVITQSISQKYFGNENPIGQLITFNNTFDFKVTGVTQDVPNNSHFKYDFLIPFNMLDSFHGEGSLESMDRSNYYTYLLFQNDVDINKFRQKYLKYINETYENKFTRQYFSIYNFQPLNKIHFEIARYNLKPSFEAKYLFIFITVGFAILILACINFINLSIAKSLNRIKEVGLRKVVGAKRKMIFIQFLGESILYTLASLLVAIYLIYQFIPYINNLLNVHFSLDTLNVSFILFIVITLIFVAFVSGSYPAIFISSFKPAIVLKPGFKGRKENVIFRNILITLQFLTSIVLISVTLIINNQLNYIENKDYGLNKENIINIPLFDESVRNKIDLLKEKLIEFAEIEKVSANRFLPSKGTFNHGIKWEGMQENEFISMWLFFVDQDFFDTYEIELISGRIFSDQFSTDDENAYILNEAAAKELGWDDPINKSFSAHGKDYMGEVIGVVKNFHFRSMHHNIEPCCIKLSKSRYNQLSIKINDSDLNTTLKKIERIWISIVPGVPFEYYFISDDFKSLYATEQKSGQLITVFTFLSIIISCLGLLGLISYSTKQRIKEIGIRKVAGASVSSIILLVSKGYLKLISFAFILAIPIIILFSNSWLRNFAYKTEISISVFIWSGLITYVIAFLAVFYQSYKTANTNIIDILRYE